MYATGETIEATATLNQAVTFDGPTPMMMMQVGDNEREMTYVPSQGSRVWRSSSWSTRTSWVPFPLHGCRR